MVTDYRHDPEYALRWPADLFREEVLRLVRAARQWGATYDWREEVIVLLRQAFPSDVPVQEFERALDSQPASYPVYDPNEEPF